jgi:hypothetical protein
MRHPRRSRHIGLTKPEKNLAEVEEVEPYSSRCLSGLGTRKLWVGGERGRYLLGDNLKVVILLTQTLCLRCSEAWKRRGHPRTG